MYSPSDAIEGWNSVPLAYGRSGSLRFLQPPFFRMSSAATAGLVILGTIAGCGVIQSSSISLSVVLALLSCFLQVLLVSFNRLHLISKNVGSHVHSVHRSKPFGIKKGWNLLPGEYVLPLNIHFCILALVNSFPPQTGQHSPITSVLLLFGQSNSGQVIMSHLCSRF